MPSAGIGSKVIGLGGGAGFSLGPIDNIFGTTSGNAQDNPLLVMPAGDLAAAESVRDAYFVANPSNLASMTKQETKT